MENEPAVCRICLEEESNFQLGKLIVPCLCSGTMAWNVLTLGEEKETEKAQEVYAHNAATFIGQEVGYQTLLGRMLSSKTFRIVSTSLILPCLAHTVGFLVLQIHQRVTGRAYDIMQIPGTMKPFRCDPFHFYALSDFHLNGIHTYVNSAASPVVLDFIRRHCPKPLIHPLYCIYARTFLGVGFIGSTTTESLLGLSGVHQPFTLLNYMRHGWLGQTLQTLTFGGRDLGLFGTLIKLSIILRGLATVTQGVYEFTGFVSDQFSRNMETDITETRSTVIKKAESNPKSLPALRVIQDWLSRWIEKYSRLEKKAGATLRNYMFQARLAFIISLM
ncbi:hypothetical protein L204_101335 [Cryptococcus depauperatus]